MDSFWVIVLFILFAIFSDRKDKKKQREQAEKRAESQRVEQAQAPQNTVTLSNLQQAVIWSEILGKPKARR